MAKESLCLDDAFRALADPTRRAVVERLASGRASVTDLAAPFDMALPSFLKHVRILEECGLVRTEKQGRTRYCAIEPRPFDALNGWLARQRDGWERHADRLEAFVMDRRKGQDDG